ncbi:MAG: DinB family protein [Chloroflexi bacterium]|nr:DinB family protein [Chloroflexota bacterium]MCC6892851.1 DinB family protein [Anaerolineae bacterium]
MHLDAINHLYDYHFAENRLTWEKYILPLTQEQFTQPVTYSVGSIRNQIVHLMNVDDIWFSALRGLAIPDWLEFEAFADRATIRAYWDNIEKTMRDYLATLNEETLVSKPLEGEDKDLRVWQVLHQVINHGTDHRAQILHILHDLGIKTVSQDYIFYVYDHLV